MRSSTEEYIEADKILIFKQVDIAEWKYDIIMQYFHKHPPYWNKST